MHGMRGGKGAVRKIDLDTFFQLAEDIAPFHALLPGFGLIGPQHFPGILREPQRIIMHAGGLAKNRAPFHLVALFQVFQDHGIQ